MPTTDSRMPRGPVPALELRIVRDRALIREAQRLRQRVDEEESGRAGGPADGSVPGPDRLDIHCEHLVVRDLGEARVVATCRLLAPDAARRAGGRFVDEHFDMERLEPLRPRMVEVGRTVIHPAYRNRHVGGLVWSGLARYLIERRLDYLVGTCEVGTADGGHAAAAIHRAASERALSPEDLRAYPYRELPLERLRGSRPAPLPTVMQGSLAMGAWVCGDPAWDRSFERAHSSPTRPEPADRGRRPTKKGRRAGAQPFYT